MSGFAHENEPRSATPYVKRAEGIGTHTFRIYLLTISRARTIHVQIRTPFFLTPDFSNCPQEQLRAENAQLRASLPESAGTSAAVAAAVPAAAAALTRATSAGDEDLKRQLQAAELKLDRLSKVR